MNRSLNLVAESVNALKPPDTEGKIGRFTYSLVGGSTSSDLKDLKKPHPDYRSDNRSRLPGRLALAEQRHKAKELCRLNNWNQKHLIRRVLFIICLGFFNASHHRI